MFPASLIQITPCYETVFKLTKPFFNTILSELRSVGISINKADGAEFEVIAN